MLNRLTLQGRFTQTPELRSTANGINVVRFTLASQRDRVGQGGERETDFIGCVAWRGTAEFICRNFSKGQSVIIEGTLHSTRWVEDDKTRYGMEVEVSAVHFCGNKNENAESETGTTENGGWAPYENALSLGDEDDLPY